MTKIDRTRTSSRPWRYELSDRLADGGDCLVIENDNGSIAEMACPADIEEANAELIVTAVNAYDPRKDEALKALVSAVQEIDRAIIGGDLTWNRKRYADSDPYHPANTKMCAALELASEVMGGQTQ